MDGFPLSTVSQASVSQMGAQDLVSMCFADDTPSKQGTQVDRLPVVPLAEAIARAGARPSVLVCIFSPRHRFANSARRVRAHCPVASVLPFFTAWFALQRDAFESYFLRAPVREIGNLRIYRDLRQALNDARSRSVLDAHLRLRFFHDASLEPSPRADIPFLAEVLSRPGLVYVDGGAFDGDTIEEFLQLANPDFAHVFALEPDPANRAHLEARVRAYAPGVRRRITIRPDGLWRCTGTAGFRIAGNMGSALDSQGAALVPVVALDQMLAGMRAPMLIKLDVEGAELDALAGAAQLVAKGRPAWAISVYHRPDDLAKVFAWLVASGHDYRMALRCHGGDGSDLILYAW
jgi:FkbM family methyltransferase